MANRTLFYAVAVLTVAGCVVWQMLCPRCCDDLPYSLAAPGNIYSDEVFWADLGDDYTCAAEVWTVIKGHLQQTSGRLSNVLFIVVQLLPLPWVKFVCGLACAGMFLGLVSLSVPQGRRDRFLPTAFVAFLFWTVFPWEDFMQSSAFVFNYPLPSAAVLLWLVLYRRLDGMTRLEKWLFILLTVPVAWLHEAFTIPLGGYVFFDWAVNRRRSWFPPAALAVMVAVVLFSLWLGTGTRVDGYELSLDSMLAHFYNIRVSVFRDSLAVVCALAGVCVYAAWPGSGRRAFLKEFLPYVGAMLTGMTFWVLISSVGRAAWGMDLFACICLTRLLDRVAGDRFRWGRVGRLATAVAVAAYGFWLAELCLWQRRSTAGTEAVYAALSPRGSLTGGDVVYADRSYAADMPFYLMGYTIPVDENNRANNLAISNYFTRARAAGIVILPERFRGIPVDSLPRIPGNAGVRGEPPYIIMDFPFEGNLRLRGGEYLPGHNPLSPLMTALKSRVFGVDANEIQPTVKTAPFFDADTVLRYFAVIETVPTTFRNRRIVEIDTIGPNGCGK